MFMPRQVLGNLRKMFVFSGHCLISENGSLLKESQRFSKNSQLIYADVDIEQLANDRKKNTTFMAHNRVFGLPAYRTVTLSLKKKIILTFSVL